MLTDDGAVSYGQLASAAREAGATLGSTPRLVLLRAANTVDTIVWYLAALAGRHPVMLTGVEDDATAQRLIDTYRPDVVVDGTTGAATVSHAQPGHRLHPSLALLLPTSGTTGTPKLVRLSRRNLLANSRSIIDYLQLTEDDRAITVLPPHYCYGLSVINTHLLVGGSLILNTESVLSEGFWASARRWGATSFAGVPYTFEQLDRLGFDHYDLPSLRYVTQAGGRLSPELVRRFALLGRQRGWRFFVMYGQTEATARMAYLPPEQAAERPSTIGIAIPRGHFTVDVDLEVDPTGDSGELVYHGPNVMLGYAHGPADLALGRSINELHTGDIARRTDGGWFELVGRRSRFVKLYGRRIDLDDLERLLAENGIGAVVAGDDRRLVVGCERQADAERAVDTVQARTGVPSIDISTVVLTDQHRTVAGKPDSGALLAAAEAGPLEPGPEMAVSATDDPGAAIVQLFRAELGVAEVGPDDSFTSLGGDSLSYVRLSVALEDRIGVLPPDWHRRSVAELAENQRQPGRLRRLETPTLLRALSIVLIVATHAGLVGLPAGGHVLLGVAGYNYARFMLGRSWPIRPIAKVVIPAVVWIGALSAFGKDDYPLASLFLVHNAVGGPQWAAPWRYWFVEVLAQILIATTLLLAIPAIRRRERARPFAFAAVVVLIGIFLRWDPLELLLNSRDAGRTLTTLWAFALGWAAATATGNWQRLAVTVAVPLAVWDFFSSDLRIAMIIGGFWLLVWVRHVPVPRPLAHGAATVAAASLFIYLTHWEVYPWVLARSTPLVSAVASLLVGIATWLAFTAAGRMLNATTIGRRRDRGSEVVGSASTWRRSPV